MDKINTPKISTCLWFNKNAEDAVKFYTTVFKNHRIIKVSHYAEEDNGGHMPAGSVLTISFELEGVKLIALNGGVDFPFSPSVSLVVNCADQGEIDYYWQALAAEGGGEEQCGWLHDKFGLRWQIVPADFAEYMTDDKRSSQLMQALMKMKKLDIAELKRAYERE